MKDKVFIGGIEYVPKPESIPEQPKPLLSGSRVGWICTHRNGAYSQILEIEEGITFGVKTNFHISDQPSETAVSMFTFDGEYGFGWHSLNIISTEPLAKEGTAEWMIQMVKLGNPVCHPNLEYASNSPYLLTDDGNAIVCRRENFLDGTYSFDYCKENYPTGWQIYETPEPPKEPQVKVGDWVYNKGIYGKLIDIDTLKNTGSIETSDAVYAYRDMDSMEKIERSEVKVTLTLEGTVVTPVLPITGNVRFQLMVNGSFYTIHYSDISPAQAELVRELVEQ